jgi:LacI family transcriptional regulator
VVGTDKDEDVVVKPNLHYAEERGSRRAGMTEVAELAGVAMSSVSRVLSGHLDVSEPMRRRVMVAVDELGYTPDLLAQGLRSRTTLSVG